MRFAYGLCNLKYILKIYFKLHNPQANIEFTKDFRII